MARKRGTKVPKLSSFPEPKPSGKVSRSQATTFRGSPALAPTALNKVSKAGGSTASPKAHGGAPTIVSFPSRPKAKGNGAFS